MIKDLTIGQFYPANSLIHKIDPRFKIVLLIAILVFIFIADNFLALGLTVAFVLAVMIITKVPISMYLKNLKIILPILIFTMLLNLFYVGEGNVLFEYWVIKITDSGISRSIFMSLRVVLSSLPM